MTRTLTVICALLATMFLYSCGTNKKLEAANATNANLQSENSQLTKTNNDLKRQVSDLNSQNSSLASQYDSYKKQCQATEQELKEASATLEGFQ